jgi:polar amino acid transport system substrate-binding protein
VFIQAKLLTTLGLALACSAISLAAIAQDRSDPLYQAGARELGASGEEQELKKEGLDALARAQKTGKITACADPYSFPYATSDGEPPGFDVEIFRAIAVKAGLKPHLFWADTGTRGGLGKALRNSIDKGNCDFFMGLAYGDDDEIKDHKLALTKPYMGMGYVLIVQGKAASIKTLEETKKNKVKIGVSMSTPLDDYLFSNGYDRSVFLQNRRIMEAMAKDEIDAGMVWSTALGEAKKDFPAAKFKLAEGFVPKEGLRFNAAWAVKARDGTMKQFLDESFEALLKSGEIKKIVESYGIPFYQPFP